MKTSSKIVLFAIVLLMASVAFFDGLLKHEYNKGSYLVPYKSYIDLHLSGFTSIKLEASSVINVKVLPGDFKVLLEPSAPDYANVRVVNGTLIIKADYKGGYRGSGEQYLLYIFCPSIRSLSCNATYRVDGRTITDTAAREYLDWKQTVIEGFTLDSLSISEGYGGNVALTNNKLRSLHAEVGTYPQSISNLVIGEQNSIGNIRLDIKNKSRVWILDAVGEQHLDYWMDDNAKLILTGKSQRLINK